MRKPTLEEVAAEAGVSKMTASRALRGASDVSKVTRAKVLNAAERLSYVGNRLALSLSSQRTNLVAVVVPSMSNIVFPEVLAGISAALEGSGMQAVFGISDYDPVKEHAIIRDMLSWQPSAIIVTGLDQPEETVRILQSAAIPVIQIMDLDGTPVDFNVGLSHGKAGEDMARALLAAGRKRFGYIGSALDRDLRAGKRKAGFERVLRENGLGFVEQQQDDAFSSIALGKRLTTTMLATAPDLDCIYYSNDDMATGGLFACMELGIATPANILIAGFNGLDLAQALPVRIATSRSPRRIIGETAGRLAREAVTDETSSLQKVFSFVPEITGVLHLQ
ncbi:LacI family DNA-binding transcriptional regulator [Rhizobium sp. LC145]|jgi:LacI family transcriptional regulator, gluconate utilization system Gnt-I transcriptional repressor|uniref:LacI family DNA-binding transcriptional regulator n=1 Tax=Rhizobium sp. LC145 TaxID=1120688 RepID=UPI000629E952|nr:LacI family DNA-binding transcriptional regulator [Rhizobium sp. LC145]KKX32977.1 LacI family transcriptional regulator [Rhizobium sp. LC145]TKT57389.1 LacI family DNA-binding transcriptional regulator [Rhizobiaceae bacterium LC148]